MADQPAAYTGCHSRTSPRSAPAGRGFLSWGNLVGVTAFLCPAARFPPVQLARPWPRRRKPRGFF